MGDLEAHSERKDLLIVDWAVASKVAAWTASRTPVPHSYRAQAMQADFDELTARAESLVEEATGLRPSAGPARGRVIDRPGWVLANIASFQRLLGPTLRRAADQKPPAPSGSGVATWLPRLGAMTMPAVSGAEMGLVLGWMSTRVLGQYDLLINEDAEDDQDVVYYVGPNVAGLEQRFGFAPKEFRLWLALHEVTHRSQFTGVPWLGKYFISLVDEGLEPFVVDRRRMADSIRRAAQEIRQKRSPLRDVGMLGLVASPEQMESLRKIQALMSLLEGHGDVTMDRAGAEAVPGAARFSKVLRERRESARGASRLLQQLLGLEAKFRQYAEGERFVRSVEEAGGASLFNRVWQGPEWLPSLTEIRNPLDWVARIGSGPSAPAAPAAAV